MKWKIKSRSFFLYRATASCTEDYRLVWHNECKNYWSILPREYWWCNRDSERRQLQTNYTGIFIATTGRFRMQNLWFQQNEATPHTTEETMAILRAAFPGLPISRSGDALWPPRSSDLSFNPSRFLPMGIP